MIFPFSPRYAFRVWRRNWIVFRRFWPAEFGPMFAEPLVVLGAMGLGLGTYVTIRGTDSYLEFIAPGIVGSYTLFAAVFECTYGSYIRMAVRGVYQAIIATPVNIEDVITGEIFWGATRSLFSACAILIVISAFGLVESPLALLVPLLALLAGLMFAGLALVFTSFAPTLSSFNYFISLFVLPMFFLSGTFFPLERYPDSVQFFAWALPLTPYVHITRNLVAGELLWSMLWALLYIVVLVAVTYRVAVFQMRRRLIR